MTLSPEARDLGERVLTYYERDDAWCRGRGSLRDVEGNVVARCILNAIYDLEAPTGVDADGTEWVGMAAIELRDAIRSANAWHSIIVGNDTICKTIEDARKAVRNALRSA